MALFMSWSSSTLFLTGLAREKLTATIMRSTKDNFAGSIVSRFCQIVKSNDLWGYFFIIYKHISFICPVYFSALFHPFLSLYLPSFPLILTLPTVSDYFNCTLFQFQYSWISSRILLVKSYIQSRNDLDFKERRIEMLKRERGWAIQKFHVFKLWPQFTYWVCTQGYSAVGSFQVLWISLESCE